MLNLKNRSIAASAALIATVVTLAAATPGNAATPSVNVAYGDLNLSNGQDVDALNSRINKAAHKVCSDSTNAIDAAVCRSRATASAHAKVAMVAARNVQFASR